MSRHPSTRIRRARTIRGMAAVLLPFTEAGEIDWAAYRSLLTRTAASGLTPAVNMDTGYVQLLDAETRLRILDTAKEVVGAAFVAGAYVADQPHDTWNHDAYARAMEAIAARGGTPIVFPSYGLAALDGADWAGAHAELARTNDSFIAFELGPIFVPYGRIYDLAAYAQLLDIPQCIGAKHSSLSRRLEWERLALRDQRRDDFLVLTGNDLAIDMVMYGSDYLLGLAAFAPEHFARRDRLWKSESAAFYELNDLLQYLGHFAFRDPVPAYKHDAAMFLHLNGHIDSPRTHPNAPERPASDRAPLEDIARRLEEFA
ncbi:MAG: dihydrodipicolinate synthase family protein [Deltaproteobacteria bacterium]